MMKLYRLEAYHWDKDYWSTIGEFISKEDAEQVQATLEKQHPFLTFTIFTKDIYGSLTDFCTT